MKVICDHAGMKRCWHGKDGFWCEHGDTHGPGMPYTDCTERICWMNRPAYKRVRCVPVKEA